MKKSLVIFSVSAIFLVSLFGLWAGRRVKLLSMPAGGGIKARFTVERGQSLKEVAAGLQKAGVIRSARYFSYMGEKENLANRIRTGEYELSSDWEPKKILAVLTAGEVVKRRFTIPEGMTLAQIADKLDREGVTNKNDFIRAASETETMSRWLGSSARNLEGTLFPDTYTYTAEDNAESIVKMMRERFDAVFTPIWTTRSGDALNTPYEAIILASIVEKESARDDERPVIAGVFLNRLKLGMRLMSDPTVIYGVPNFNGNLTRADLRRPAPYNTYLNAGLPPGPICNPGAASLSAALNPARVEALYFVSRGNGSHQFSVTLDEHNKAVEQYQRRRAQQ